MSDPGQGREALDGPGWWPGHPYWMHYGCLGCRKCKLIGRGRRLLRRVTAWGSR